MLIVTKSIGKYPMLFVPSGMPKEASKGATTVSAQS
jgi:hypothetical protein